MKRPRFLGFFNDAPVFRIDSPEAARRVWRAPKWKETNTHLPFRPGLRVEVTGFSLHLSALTPEQWAETGIDLDAVCSTPRPARSLRAHVARGAS